MVLFGDMITLDNVVRVGSSIAFVSGLPMVFLPSLFFGIFPSNAINASETVILRRIGGVALVFSAIKTLMEPVTVARASVDVLNYCIWTVFWAHNKFSGRWGKTREKSFISDLYLYICISVLLAYAYAFATHTASSTAQ
mmetsp:Transcript_1154/g.2639  ORF Transcript_1154/g.2639 Transcript_1154/m.2639 type:complete len:139 (-) Transcript_1154:34-450(-)|eukprot:CAMPEP_0198324982 /NCGR_PEP_ID=MMETSP1450-20131203/12853_1 /TAXON_ID=753684 ORGANISM="Madagascaria erythrocladiodes, Strain CCMP3234" /NCGR_SAMPLE_ID=MMETSP1450 /ASSEMBLY_ACC=CAM_ASM_001115 /LENGTH=138 /DNA_ID=CAMNT_0044028823 /DNA_START=268 /DNA_END=684 /DNA_ORIENTATION=+